MTITPAQSVLLKGLLLTVVASVLAFFTNAANLEGVFPPVLVTIITLIASRFESAIKEQHGKALFGAARVR